MLDGAEVELASAKVFNGKQFERCRVLDGDAFEVTTALLAKFQML